MTNRNRILLGQSRDRLSEVIFDLRNDEKRDKAKNHGQLLHDLNICLEHLEAVIKV